MHLFILCRYIVGIVKTFDNDSKERVVNKATNQKSSVFNFTLEGQEGLIIHLCCWKENLHILEGKIIAKNVRFKNYLYFLYSLYFSLQVLLIDGPFARPVSKSYSEDGRIFQLTIRPNTRVYVLRDVKPLTVALPTFEEAVHYKSIQEILNSGNGEDKVPVGKY